MFEQWLSESLGDPGALLSLAADTYEAERRAGCRKLMIAAAWADCHGAPAELELADDTVVAAQSVLVDRFVRMGPQGTPLVAECCPAELGTALHTTPVAARNLIRVALVCRYRLPWLWARVCAGEVWLWKVRLIAEASAHLSVLTSWELDRQTAPLVESMAWSRFWDVFDAALLSVDEATYRQREHEAVSQREVMSYRGQYGLRTLVAKAEAGDVLAFEALVARVADCLAEEGDEDPVGVRRSKAIGIIAHPAKLRALLARHADAADDPRHPEDRVAAHEQDPSDPWAADDLPPAGWETARHGNVHQPGFDDLDDLADCWAAQTPPDPEPDGASFDPADLIDEADRAWFEQHRDEPVAEGEPDDHETQDHESDAPGAVDDVVAAADPEASEPTADERADAAADDELGDVPVDGERPQAEQPSAGEHGRDELGDGRADVEDHHASGIGDAQVNDHAADDADTGDHAHAGRVPAAFDRSAGRDQRGACRSCGSVFDLAPMSPAELDACRCTAVVHVHVTDQTLVDQHGVLRTADGPITLEQFRRWLTDTDPKISIRPVLDPAQVAAVDSYEIPLAIREAVQTRHPGSVWPFSAAAEITVGGRLDLDHTIPYVPNGPPGQTGVDNLGPLARSEHRPRTVGGTQVRQPDLGVYVWRSPHGLVSIVTNQGTLTFGDRDFAQRLWAAAQPAPPDQDAEPPGPAEPPELVELTKPAEPVEIAAH